MTSKKKFLIVTSNDYLIYQPTILGIYDFLAPHFDVTIISFEPHFVSKEKDITRSVKYIRILSPIRFIVQNLDSVSLKVTEKFSFLKSKKRIVYTFFHRLQMIYLKRALKKFAPDRILAVDIPSLYIVQSLFPICDFLSLEIYPSDPFQKKIDVKKIDAVIIQNQARFTYLFGQYQLKTFFVQNAPVFAGLPKKLTKNEDLIWAGSILKRFSVLDCIEFIEHYPSYNLVLKGGGEQKTVEFIRVKYQNLIESKKLVIDQSYLPANEFINYLSNYKIGICFYSWDLIKSSINYQTAPSGKVFMYLAAGVPVIACDIPGFDFIRDFEAGVLIGDYKPETIKTALDTIEKNYESYQRGCFKAAEHFSFDKSIEPYVKYVREKLS